jgi:hypothetical protein|tara:strand:- start:585 stop:926 length:342 start_codon:yes stop_codon:yes gene_type:complete
MALALNVFKTITKVATTNAVGIYTAPVGYTGVVLLAQAANIGNNTRTVSFSHKRTVIGIAVTTEILKDFPISASDTANLVAGKLVLESGDVLVLSASSGTDIKFLGSILETLN